MADMANEILLLMPIVPLVGVLAWQGRRMTLDRKPGGDVPWAFRPELWHFVTLMLVPGLAYLTVFNPAIGMARDWDLFGMFSVVVLSRYLQASGANWRTAAVFSTPALVLTMVLAVAWFGINASKWRTAERFETILTYDLAHGSYAGENLAIFYHENGRLDRSITIMENTYQRWHNPRHGVRLAVYYEEAKRLRDSAQLLYSVLERHPADERARMKLLMILDGSSRWSDMVAVAREGTVHDPKKPAYHFYLGESLIQTGNVDEGLDAFLRCLERDPPPSAKAHIEERFDEYGKKYERVE
jgi:tetratricopeptide (TPR) repeat protein